MTHCMLLLLLLHTYSTYDLPTWFWMLSLARASLQQCLDFLANESEEDRCAQEAREAQEVEQRCNEELQHLADFEHNNNPVEQQRAQIAALSSAQQWQVAHDEHNSKWAFHMSRDWIWKTQACQIPMQRQMFHLNCLALGLDKWVHACRSTWICPVRLSSLPILAQHATTLLKGHRVCKLEPTYKLAMMMTMMMKLVIQLSNWSTSWIKLYRVSKIWKNVDAMQMSD